MLNVCITFDYEIFFGKNYCSCDEVLFSPTDRLLKMLDKNDVKATFFADVCSVTQHIKIGEMDYVDSFTKQIQNMTRIGQDVQLHIHPHWLTSEYDRNEGWIFDKSRYRIQSFGSDKEKENSIYSIIQAGKKYLEQVLRPIDKNYQCIAYRAGGFVFQPHESLVFALVENGIRIDSSIAPHLKSEEKTNGYDYSDPPPEGNWWISSRTPWNKNSEKNSENIFEVPIAVENKNPFFFGITRVFNKSRIKLPSAIRRGTYINEGNIAKKTIGKYKKVFQYLKAYNALSLDSYNYRFLYRQLKRMYRKCHCEEQDIYVCLICHPKLTSEITVQNMEFLIKTLKKDSKRFDFTTMKKIYDSLLEYSY